MGRVTQGHKRYGRNGGDDDAAHVFLPRLGDRLSQTKRAAKLYLPDE
jgi:hypothetical protein